MWFDGPIETAISKAKSEDRLLIIFISGSDPNSNRVLDYWSEESVKSLVVENSCIALKLAEGSEAAKQFGQIYPVINIPMCFFITPNSGTPLEIILDIQSLDHLKERLSKTIELFRSGITVVEKEKQATAASSDGAGPSENLQDRVQRAQTLIKERQEQKFRDAEEKERTDEAKRRHAGQEFQKAQERIKEAEALQAARDQKKAKKDNQEHLKKLREQIAADRAEKAAKFSNVQVEKQQAAEEKKEQKKQADEVQRKQEEEQRKRYSLIQFRMPDGSSLRNQFDGTAHFADVRLWISETARLPIGTFVLVQMFPRREFAAADGLKTLAELDLTPNAVLMILPTSTASSGPRQAANPGVIGWLRSMAYTVIIAPLRYVLSFIIGQPRQITAPPSSTPPNENNSRPSTSSGKDSSSNVVRFRNTEDAQKKPDADNATWNGNSTQQL